MRLWRYWIVVAAFALQSMAMAQAPDSAPSPPVSPSLVAPLSTIPVPYDPLEMVTNNARQVRDAVERAAALDLLQKAHRFSNVRLHPYDLKTSFTSYGSSSSDGRWILEDTSPGANIYRWTAQGPSFLGIFLTTDKLVSSNQPGGAMPLRLAQVRDVMWGAYFPQIGPRVIVRVANGNLNGAELHCLLVSRGFYGNAQRQFSSGRSFDETEYCVNPQTGLLETYSRAAGLYVRFDYANALHFHEQIIPGGFTVTEHGRPVIEARTESVGEAPSKESGLFQPAGLSPLGVGLVIPGPMTVWSSQSSPLVGENGARQVVVLHGMVSPDGHFSETEVLASTNEALDQAALDHANKDPFLKMTSARQPGTTPQSREAIFTVEFLPPPKNCATGIASSVGSVIGSPVRCN